MKKVITFIGLSLALSGLCMTQANAGSSGMITVYHTSDCIDQESWVSNLKEHDYEVDTVIDDTIDKTQENFGVPDFLRGCYTAIAGDYFLQGPVKVSDIQSLLAGYPSIRGLAMDSNGNMITVGLN